MTVGYDIAFRIYKNSAGTEIELVPSNKTESHLMMEEGEIICETTGNCKWLVQLNKWWALASINI